MRIKRIIKKIIGERIAYQLIGGYEYLKIIRHHKSRVTIGEDWELLSTIGKRSKHVFCGYYDIRPNSIYDKNTILVHVLSRNAQEGKDYIELALVNIKTQKIDIFARSYAWCWQMGSRLRWSMERGCVYYNDTRDGEYICKKYNIISKEIIREFPNALYDINIDETLGAYINFSRLQRLRRGYGYSNVKDNSIGEIAPANDGLYLMNLENGQSSLAVSYSELFQCFPGRINGECYINHISFSPNGKQIIFFFIWVTKTAPGWNATLFMYDVNSNEFTCLEANDQVSHYAWKDVDHVLITGINHLTNIPFYRIYDIPNCMYYELSNEKLKQDGHPVYFNSQNGWFYTDTYPDIDSYQKVLKIENSKVETVASFFHDPRMFSYKRCDLHPHLFNNSESIAVDTTFTGNRRQVVVLNEL